RPPGNYASGAASLSPHRLQRRTPHRRSGQNHPLDHCSSNKIAAAVLPLLPTTPLNASPAQAAASSNPHSHQPPTRRPAGSFLGGFRTPALRARANVRPRRHPKPFTIADHRGSPADGAPFTSSMVGKNGEANLLDKAGTKEGAVRDAAAVDL